MGLRLRSLRIASSRRIRAASVLGFRRLTFNPTLHNGATSLTFADDSTSGPARAMSQCSDTVRGVTTSHFDSPRKRGKNKRPAWRLPKGQVTSTFVVSLDTSDAHMRRRLQTLYFVTFNLRRALQRDAQILCRAYWARKEDRDTLGWKAVAEDLGLTRNGFAKLARNHARNSRWANDHVSMALVNHMADA
ncbi:MAG TPA: hypothetical protein VNT80_01845, partial [Acidimicrobiales bacterium]|nr:hypothetical protein [Acidimicrobiales bacterium]